MTGFGVLLRKELLEQWLTMRLVIVVGLYLAFGILSPIFARYLPEIIGALVPPDQLPIALPTPTVVDAVSQFVKNVGSTLTLVAILLAMGLVASEKERGTAAFILTKPAGRAAFLAAKFGAVGLTLGIAMAVSGAAAYGYTALLFEAPPLGGFVAMCALLWLGQLVIASFTLLGSALVRSVAPAAGIGFAAFIGLSIVSALPTLGPYTPPGLLGPATALAAGTDPGNVLGPVAVNAALAVGAVVFAWLSFRRQEL